MVCCSDQIGNLSRMVVLGFTGLAIALQVISATNCEFMVYESDEYPNGKIGLFVDNDDRESCPSNIGTEELDDDPFLRAARSMMTLSIIGAVGSACLVCFEFLCCRICCAAVLESLAFMGASFMGGLVYVAFGSEYCTGEPQDLVQTIAQNVALGSDGIDDDVYQCSFGKGCSYNLVAIMIYFGSAIALCCTPKPTPILRQSRK